MLRDYENINEAAQRARAARGFGPKQPSVIELQKAKAAFKARLGSNPVSACGPGATRRRRGGGAQEASVQPSQTAREGSVMRACVNVWLDGPSGPARSPKRTSRGAEWPVAAPRPRAPALRFISEAARSDNSPARTPGIQLA